MADVTLNAEIKPEIKEIKTAVENNTNGDTKSGESALFGVSIRGIIALLFVITVCAMALMKFTIDEKLFSLAIGVVSFYFGKNTKSA